MDIIKELYNKINDESESVGIVDQNTFYIDTLSKRDNCFQNARIISKILKKKGFNSPQYIIPIYYMSLINCGIDFDIIGDLTDDKVAKTIYLLNQKNFDSKVKWVNKLLQSKTATTVKAAEMIFGLYCSRKNSNNDALNYISEVVTYYSLVLKFSPYAKLYYGYRNTLLKRFNISDINILILQRLSEDYDFQYEILSKTVIKIKSKYDIWKIAYCSRKRIQLFHLNRGQRGKYHIQREFSGWRAQLPTIFEYIKAHDQYVEKVRI